MPFAKRSEKKKTAPATLDARRIFVGREQELHFIQKHIVEPEAPDHNMVSFYGQGGIGKSTLLSRLESDIRNNASSKDSCLIARVNERQMTPASVMEAFADQLDLKGEFEKALGHYKEALRKLYDEREQEQETFGRKATTTLVGSVAKGVPVVGGLLSQGAEQVSELIWDEVLYRQRLKDARRLENPVQDLTDRFITELNKLAERQGGGNKPVRRILLCFDTFEQLTTEIAPWLLDYFLEEEINENIVLVVAGRHALSDSTPNDPKRWLQYTEGNILHEIELKTFSREETASYLIQRGITEETRVNQVWHLSRGLPLYLGMLTANQNGKLDPTADVVQNFLRWIPPGEEVKQRVVLDAALFSRAFNRDDFKAFNYIAEEQRTDLHRWLLLQPFIRPPESGRNSYHEIAQEMFSRYLYSSSPQDCRETRKALAAHYEKSLAAVEASEGEYAPEVEEWLELALALAQQLLLLSDEEKLLQAVGLVVRAIGAAWEPGRSEKVGSFLQKLRDGLGQQMTERARRMLRRLIAYQSQVVEKPEWYEAVQEFIQRMLPSSQHFLDALVILHFTRAKAYLVQERYEEALQDFQRVLELNPLYARAWYSKGATLGKLKRGDEALAAYEEAIRLDPHYVAAWNNKGDMLDALERYEEALAAYDRAIRLNPQYSRAWYNKGITLWNQERYEEALTAYDEAIRLNPHYADAWYNKGVVLNQLKRYGESTAAFEEALTTVIFNATNPIGWKNRGDMLVSLNRPDQALTAYDEAIRLGPRYTEAWHNKGVLLRNLDRNEEALNCFDKALTVNPRHANAWYYKGYTLTELKQYEEALVSLDKALDIDPLSALAWNDKGYVLVEFKQFEESLVCFDKALTIDPQYTTALNSKGYSLIELKRYEEALVSLDKALDINPYYSNAWRWKAKALGRMNRNEEALASLNKALEINPRYIGALYEKGVILRQLERYEEALEVYDQAIRLDQQDDNTQYAEYYEEVLAAFDQAINSDPQNADLWYKKGIVLQKLGRSEEQKVAQEQAMKLNPQYEFTALPLTGGSPYVSPDLVSDEFLDEEIVILLQGTNLAGDEVYSYVKVIGRDLKRMFAKMRAGENFRPAEYGEVIAAGSGEPPEDVREEMKKEYNMIDVPMPPKPVPAIQPKSSDDENMEE